jgi:hypothetical protein
MPSSAEPGAPRRALRTRIVAAPALALVLLAAAGAPASAAAGGDRCIGGEEARAAGEDDGPPTIDAALRRRTLTLDVSLDGLDGSRLPMSIEAVCAVPGRLARAAAQLAGSDAIALVSARTTVAADGQELRGGTALDAIDGADTARVRGRMAPPNLWENDEDGNAVPTFNAGRVTVTD